MATHGTPVALLASPNARTFAEGLRMIESTLSTQTCPRCTTQLFRGTSQSFALHGCGGCGGVWLDNAACAAVLVGSSGARATELAELVARNARTRVLDLRTEVRCPECGVTLERVRKHGIEMDVCAAHGTWFDAHELRQVVQGSVTPIVPPAPVVVVPEFIRPQTTSSVAIAGFVLAFFCGPLGLFLSWMGLREVQRSGGSVGGEGLAKAGIIVSIAFMGFGFLYALVR
jgi:Zn-finger nucleic acid-binding protein